MPRAKHRANILRTHEKPMPSCQTLGKVMANTRELPAKHTVNKQRAHGKHMPITRWIFAEHLGKTRHTHGEHNGEHAGYACQTHCKHMGNIRRTHVEHMANTWQTQGKHMGNTRHTYGEHTSNTQQTHAAAQPTQGQFTKLYAGAGQTLWEQADAKHKGNHLISHISSLEKWLQNFLVLNDLSNVEPFYIWFVCLIIVNSSEHLINQVPQRYAMDSFVANILFQYVPESCLSIQSARRLHANNSCFHYKLSGVPKQEHVAVSLSPATRFYLWWRQGHWTNSCWENIIEL